MVDSNHAGDKATRQCWSSILAFMNIAPIDIDNLLQEEEDWNEKTSR
jgi:hypothetical protein